MDLSKHADFALLERYGANRSEAEFAELVSRYRMLVLGTAGRILGNEADAEDAAQAAFVALALKTPRLRPGQSLAPWLHTVTVRAAFDLKKMAHRRMSREGQAVKSLQTLPPLPSTGIDAELEKLPKKLSAMLVAHYLEGWSIDELARRENCATSTISMRLNRGRDQLRKRLGQNAALSSLAAFTLASRAIDQGSAFTTATLKVASQALAGIRIAEPRISSIARMARHALRPTPLQIAFPALVSVGICGAIALTALTLPTRASPNDEPSRNAAVTAAKAVQPAQGMKSAPAIAGESIIEAQFDFVSLPNTSAAQAMIQARDADALFNEAFASVKAGHGMNRGRMIVSCPNRLHVAVDGVAKIEAEMTHSPDEKLVDLTLSISIGEQNITAQFEAPVGRCVLVGVIPDPFPQSAGAMLVFGKTAVVRK